MPERLDLPVHDPQDTCPACDHDGLTTVLHAAPIAVFHAPGFACSAYAMELHPPVGQHMCRKCRECGYAWMEQRMSEPGATMGQGKEQDMSIRKTGSATGEVTGFDPAVTSDDDLIKQGSAQWQEGDEQGLAAENDAADRPD